MIISLIDVWHMAQYIMSRVLHTDSHFKKYEKKQK